MRVLIASDYATRAGGAEVMTGILRDGLRARGHEARVFASSAGLEPGDTHAADYVCTGTTSRFRTLLQVANPMAARGLARAIDDFRPDVVHVRMFLTQLSPLILPVLRRVPSLYHVVWYRPVCPLGTKLLPDGTQCRVSAGFACLRNRCLPLHDWAPLMLQRHLQHKWMDAFDRIVANSDAVRRSLLEAGLAEVTVVRNGVPVCEPRPALDDPPSVLFAGRLVREKGADVLLRAFAATSRNLPHARLVLAGDGPERESLRRLAGDLGVASRIDLTGQLSATELDKHRQRAWVQAVPSRWAEPFGIVAAEAMMRGVAVVASDAGGLAEIVRQRVSGLLVPPGDVDALASALSELLSSRALAERMGASGRRVALDEFSDTVFVERFLAMYRSMISRAEHTSPGVPR